VLVAPTSNEAFDVKSTELAHGLFPNEPKVCEFLFDLSELLVEVRADHTIWPPLKIISGLAPKNSGRQMTKSAILLGSTDPTACEQPVTSAGLIVYLAK